MDAALNRKSLQLGITGLALQFAGIVLPAFLGYAHSKNMPEWLSWVTTMGIIGGGVLFILGLSYYAAAKGHSRWAGLLGLFSIFGLLVLALLPDRRKAQPLPPR
jgi:hypothetical protein